MEGSLHGGGCGKAAKKERYSNAMKKTPKMGATSKGQATGDPRPPTGTNRRRNRSAGVEGKGGAFGRKLTGRREKRNSFEKE